MEKVRRFGLVIWVLLGTSTASAQSERQREEAQVHFKRGAELYDEDNFRGALIEFQAAYELAPSYKIQFNIGQVEMELQDYAGAQRAYARYLREGGPDVPAARVEQVSREIERLKGRVGEIVIQTTAGAEVLIDDVSIGFAPLPEAVVVNTGRHQLIVHVPGREPAHRVVDVAGQQSLTVAIANDLSSRAPARVVAERTRSNRGVYIGWSVTGALAVAAGIAAAVTYSRASDLDALRDTYPVTKEQLDAQASKQQTASRYADGFAVAAVVAGSVSLYLTLTRSKPSTESNKSVTLQLRPTGAFVAGSF